jgi:16S rRNA (uracil1498-N3)-methyltransferase
MAVMPRFFISSDQVHDGSAVVLGADAAHLTRTLRVRPGELVVVVEAGSVEHGVRIDDVSAARVSGRITWSRPATGEPGHQVHVVQAVPAKGMELAVEALTEAGAAVIWPVLTARSVARPGADRVEQRIERWRAVAREAAQLAGRAGPPDIRQLQSLPDAVQRVSGTARLLACVIDATAAPLPGLRFDAGRAVAIAIGPEGGFDAAERAVLDAAGAENVHLGPRVLPTWLAGALAVSLVLAAAGDLNPAVAPSPS